MNGTITLSAVELLAIAALPLSSISGVLKHQIEKRLGGQIERDRADERRE